MNNKTHDRFNRKIWTFKKDFTSALAKCLVQQSPYTVPDNLSVCIEKFSQALDDLIYFNPAGMAEVSLLGLAGHINEILESIPEIMALNEPKNKTGKTIFFTSRYDKARDPDDDFIDIMAAAQNITCEFADREDARCWLDQEAAIKEK